MAHAQQRRRASCIEPLKQQQISPTSLKNTGFRLFAGSASSASSTISPNQRIRVDVPGNNSIVKPNASVSVSYPNQIITNRRLPFIGRFVFFNTILRLKVLCKFKLLIFLVKKQNLIIIYFYLKWLIILNKM